MGIVNRDGALWMATGVDNSGLYNGFNQAENRVDQFEAHIKRVGDNITRLTGIGFGVAGLKAFGSEIINVRGEMQMLESSFEVLLGGKGVSGFMSEMKQFAVDSPLSMNGVANAAQTLLGFGIAAEKVMPTIKQIGDISMGNEDRFKSLSLAFAQMSATGKLMGQDLLQMINAGFNPLMTISEKTGKSIGDLKKEMENGSISSQMVADAFASATAEGGKFYGMTQKQAEGIRGLQAQLEGALQEAFNEIGKSQEGLIAGGYKAATSLVESYDKVGKAIIALIATYGVYKAAVVFTTQAEAGWNAVQLITYNRLLLVEKAQKLLNATMLSNPYVLLATITISLVATMWALHDATTTQEKAQERLNKLNEEATQIKENLENKTSQLIGVINSETKTIFDQITAYQELQGLYPKYLANMDRQTFKALGATQQQKLLNEALNEIETNASIAQIEALEKKISEMQSQKENSRDADEILNLGEEIRIQTEILNGLKEQKKQREENLKQAQFETLPEEEKKKIYKEQLSSLEKQKALIESQIPNINNVNTAWNKLNPTFILLNNQLGDILSKIADTRAKLEDKPTSKNKSFWEKEKKDAEDALGLMDQSAKGSAEWKKQLDKLNTAKVKLGIWDFSGKSQKSTDSRAQKMRDAQSKLSNLQSELDSQTIQQQLDHEQKLLDIEQDSFDKRYRQNQLNTAKEFVAIEEYRQKMAKAQQEAAKNIYVSKNGTETGFDYSSFNKSLLPDGLKDSDIESQVQQMTDAIVAAYKKGNEDLAKEQQVFADEERLTFASQLDQQIYSIRTHYEERRQLAKGNADLLKQINDNENREITAARLQSHQRQLESDADYNQKYLQLVEDRYVFESDKQKASLEQQIRDQKKIFNDLEKQVLNDPNNSELANQLRDAYIQLRILNKELAKTPNQKFAEIAGYVNEVVSSLSQLDGLEDLDKLSSFISSGDQFAKQDYIGGGLSALSGIVGLITSASQEKERQAKIQREINKLQQQYNIDLRQQNVDLISSIDYVRVFRDNLEALQWLVEKGFISNVDYSAWDALNTQFKVLKDNISAAQSEYDKYSNQGNDFINNLSRFSMLNSTIRKAVDELNKGIAAGDKNATLNALEILASSDNTWSDKAKDLADQLSKAGSEVTDLTSQMAELSQQMDEFATGTSFDSFLSDAANAIKDLRGDISGLADFTEEKMTNAILSSFKYQILSNALKPMYDELSDMFLSGDFDSSKANDWKQRLTDILKTNGEELDKIFDAFGVDPDTTSTSQSTSKGGFETMTQDQAGEMNGRLTGIHETDIRIEQNTLQLILLGSERNTILKGYSEGFQAIRNVLVETRFILEEVRDSNNELYEIKDTLIEIRKNTKGLVTK